MYNSLLTEDTYKRADFIYKGIAEEYNPFLREFVTCSKIHEKNFVETGRSYKASHDAAVKIGIAATSSPGCKDVGKCIMSIAETLQEVNMVRDDWLQKFRGDIIYPMERRLEQDSKYVVGLRKKSQEEFKTRSSETEKAFLNLAKLKKKTVSKSPSRKTEDKLQKGTERLLAAKAASEIMAHEMLSRAFSEERRRYCFFVEKQCDLIQAWMNYHRESFDILQQNLDEWQEMASSYRELLPGAVALIESSWPRRNNTTLDDLDINAGIRASRLSSEDFSAVYQVPGVTQPVLNSDKPNANLRRNMSTRVVGSAKEVDPSSLYEQIQLNKKINGDGRENQLSVPDSVIESTRSSESSIHLRSLFRNSTSSTISALSQGSTFSSEMPETGPYAIGNMRSSLNDSGISVGETWGTDADDCNTIKRVKSKAQKEKYGDGDTDNKSTESEEGIFAKDTEIKNESPAVQEDQAKDAKTPAHYRAFHDFDAESGKSKLSLRRGDVIAVMLNEDKGGWMYGENQRSNLKGWFPISYTTLISNEEKNQMIEPEKKDEVEEVTSQSSQNKSSTPEIADMKETPTINITCEDESEEKSTNDSPSRNRGPSTPPPEKLPVKKPVGMDVFHFARGLKNPFEDVQLRKTNTASLN